MMENEAVKQMHLSVRIDKELHNRIRKCAAKKRIGVADYVRDVLDLASEGYNYQQEQVLRRFTLLNYEFEHLEKLVCSALSAISVMAVNMQKFPEPDPVKKEAERREYYRRVIVSALKNSTYVHEEIVPKSLEKYTKTKSLLN